MSANVILGGGFTGLFSALLLVEKYKQKNVVIIESSNQIGGAYNSCFLEKNRYFDFGPHLVYESENDEINQLIISLMNDDQWLFLEKNEKDIPGLYYNGALQEHSHYIDIRTLDNTLYHECIADLFINLDHKSNEKSKDHSAEEYFINKFGKIITNTAIKKIIKKLWGKDLNSIDWFVAKLVSMDRVVAFSEETMLDLMKAEKIRERIAYPNQYTFPSEKRSSKQRALYPKEFGFFRIIDALKKRLEEQGVKIYMSTSIESLNVIDNKIKSISFLKNNTTEIDSIDDIRHIHSTIDLVHITKYLNIKYEKPKLDEHRKVAYVFLSLKSRPEMGKLYYFYVFDEKFKTFRVTSYANYCNDAAKNGEYPVCVELHFDSSEDCKNSNFIDIAISELLSLGTISSSDDVVFGEYKFFERGFPVPTLVNNSFYANIRNLINQESISNLTLGGIGLDKKLFFLHDILDDSYDSLYKSFSNVR